MKRIWDGGLAAAVLAGAALAGVAGAQAPASGPACGSGAAAGVCFGAFDVPSRYRADFAAAGGKAVDALHSPAFEADLARFIAAHTASGAHAAAWRGVEAGPAIAAMRARIGGQTVNTYGGLMGWLRYRISGNLAFDGVANGPIRVNRAALPRPVGSLTQTLVHELAHRAGLTHPHSDTDLKIAACEPPYVIGALAEKQVVGAGWKPGRNDCPLIDS